MTEMTFEELRDIWERELRNQRVPSPVEPTLYDDMRIICPTFKPDKQKTFIYILYIPMCILIPYFRKIYR